MGRPDGEDYSLVTILSEKNVLMVPRYQRDYDWKRKTFDKLVDDLVEHALEPDINQETEPYFLGNLIIQKEVNEWFLVDGQQRTTALTLLTCAIRDLMIDNEQFAIAEKVHNKILYKEGHGFRYSPKVGSDTKRFLGYYQSYKDIQYNIVFSEEITESTETYAVVEQFTPKRTIHQGTPFDIEGVGTIIIGGNIACEPKVRIQMEINLDENSIINQGQILEISLLDRTNYDVNHGPIDERRLVSVHYKRARNSVKKRLEQFVEDEEGNSSTFFRKLYRMLINLSFTTTEFEEVDDAIYYFEVLNDDSNRLSLSAGDLLRAKIETLSRDPDYTPEHQELMKSKLELIEENLKEDGSYDYISEFMWTWLLSRGKRVSKRKTWAFFKQLLEDEVGENIIAIMNTLAKESKLFREIYAPELGDPEFGGLFALSGVVKQHHPLLLNVYAAYKDFADENNNDYRAPLRRITRIFSYLILRGFILPGEDEKIPSNRLYKIVEQQCKSIWAWPEDADNWKDYVNSGHPTSERVAAFLDEFSNTVSEMVVDKPFLTDAGRPVEQLYQNPFSQSHSKLILSYIEWYLRGFHENPTWTDGVEVEHILPQKPKKYKPDEDGEGFVDWGQFSEEEHSMSKQLLGNRLLLPEGANKKLKNFGFTRKKEMQNHGYDARAASWKLVALVSQMFENWNVESINSLGKIYSGLTIHIFGHESFLQTDLQIDNFERFREQLEEYVELNIPDVGAEEE